MGVGGLRHAPAALLAGKRTKTGFIGGWLGPRSSWTGEGNLVPSPGFRSLDRPAHSESQY